MCDARLLLVAALMTVVALAGACDTVAPPPPPPPPCLFTDTLTVRVVYHEGGERLIDSTMTTKALACGECAKGSTLACLQGYASGVVVADCSEWTAKWPGLECVTTTNSSGFTVNWVAWWWDGTAWQRIDSGIFTLVLRNVP